MIAARTGEAVLLVYTLIVSRTFRVIPGRMYFSPSEALSLTYLHNTG